MSRWSLLLPLLLALVLLFLAFRGVAWHTMFDTLRRGRLDYLGLGLLVLTLSYFTRGLRWRVLLAAERQISPPTMFWAIVLGYLGNNFLPARAGEVVRSVMLSRATGSSTSYVLATALTERILDAVALVLISTGALMSVHGMPAWLLTASRGTAVLGAIGLAAVLVLPRLAPRLRIMLTRRSEPDGGLAHRLADLLDQFLLGMRAFQHPTRALSFTVFTGAVWLLDSTVAILVAHALHFSLSLAQALLLLAALGLGSAAPSTPGYVGIYQFVAVTILTPFGFSRAQALAYIIALQALIYAVILFWSPVGFWRLTALRRSRRWRDASVNPAEGS